ncbi:MAG: hypothetical protein K1X83_15400, partial [Oligoflexia bacterium]|nr:hypothetical protein [Oligoflexia bacterium]
ASIPISFIAAAITFLIVVYRGPGTIMSGISMSGISTCITVMLSGSGAAISVFAKKDRYYKINISIALLTPLMFAIYVWYFGVSLSSHWP